MDQDWECLDGNEAAARVAYGVPDGGARRRLGGRGPAEPVGRRAMTSALLRDGPSHVRTVEDPSAFERANYMDVLHSWTAAQDAAFTTSS